MARYAETAEQMARKMNRRFVIDREKLRAFTDHQEITSADAGSTEENLGRKQPKP